MNDPESWAADFLDSLEDERERKYFEGAVVFLRDHFAGDEEPEPEPPAPAFCQQFDRIDKVGNDDLVMADVVRMDRHSRAVVSGQSGGLTTLERYGVQHFRVIGKAGYQATKRKHGLDYATGLLRKKGWYRPQGTTLEQDLALVGKRTTKIYADRLDRLDEAA